MNGEIIEAVSKAREFFKIKEFPGNFFRLIEDNEYIDKYNILLFKEDIGKLSGFIGYGENELTVICINYKRPIGHQNFTFAHELGHWFLHKGQNISDEKVGVYTSNVTEQEANEFAAELLYPEAQFLKDYDYLLENQIMKLSNWREMGEYVDLLCHRYCLSYEVVLRKILFKARIASEYTNIRKQIEKSLGGKISDSFERDFYIPNDKLEDYQQLRKPYKVLEQKVNKLVSEGKIGQATADSIKLRNGIELR